MQITQANNKMLTKEEVWIAYQQSNYERPDITGVSEESRRGRTIANFWSEGEEELNFRPASQIPTERYAEICQEFRKLVKVFVPLDIKDLSYSRIFEIAEKIGLYQASE